MNNEDTNLEESIHYNKFISDVKIIKRDLNWKFSYNEKYYEKKFSDVPKPPDENNYWKNFFLKKGFYDFTKDEAKAVLDSRIDFLVDYFKRLFNNRLTDEELNKPKPTNFKGPYLPTLQDFEKLEQLSILVNCEHPQISKRKKSESKVNNRHREKILDRWIQFQKEYKFYDLRPLIGCRCAILQRKGQEVNFVFYRALNKKQFRTFIIYMGASVPELNYFQVRGLLLSLCDSYSNNGKNFNIFGNFVSGYEYRLMYEIYDRFGNYQNLCNILSVLIGKRTNRKYRRLSRISLFRRVPFTDKKWSKDEDIALIKLVQEYSGVKDLKSLLCMKEKVKWQEIAFKMKLRREEIYQRHYDDLKQNLLDAILKREEKLDDSKLIWTPEKTIKLIELVYETNVTSVRDIDWYSMLDHFPGYTGHYLGNVFNKLTKTRVPRQKRKYFEDLVEYLYHKVKPVYKLKDKRFRKRKCAVDLLTAVESSAVTVEERNHLHNYFNENFDRDSDDELFAIENINNEVSEHDQNFSSGENNIREIPLWEDFDENDLKRGEKFRKHSRIVFNIEDDELFWQEMMQRANFDCNLSPELKKKLRCYWHVDITQGNSTTDSELEENVSRYKSICNKNRAIGVPSQTLPISPLQNKKYIFSNENRNRVKFGKKRKRECSFNESSTSLNNSGNISECSSLTNSETNHAECKSSIDDNEIIVLSSDESCVEIQIESKSVRKRQKNKIRRLNKSNKNSQEILSKSTSCDIGRTCHTDLEPKAKKNYEEKEEHNHKKRLSSVLLSTPDKEQLLYSCTHKKKKRKMNCSSCFVADELTQNKSIKNISEDVSFIKKKKKKKKKKKEREREEGK
ncbi:UNVERIFIED_CONTAM: hypothetical protein RMT77_007999 [Armadillidium vulgare]